MEKLFGLLCDQEGGLNDEICVYVNLVLMIKIIRLRFVRPI